MTRLYVVEQSGLEPGGHYHAYTACVVDGARQLGLDTVVLANKRLRAASGAKLPPDIVPCFTYTWSEAELHGKLEWVDGNIAYEMFEAFRRVPPADDDHVFLHTLGYRELRALLAALTGKMSGDSMPYFNILLRRDPDILISNYGDYGDYFALLAMSPYLRRKIRLYTDTDLLSAAFANVCGLPFATAPIPFDQSLLRQSLAARQLRKAGDPLTIVYLGDAREEKGFQHLPQALSYLWKDYVAPGRVRFVLQSNFNTPGGEPGILSASQNLAGFLATTLKAEPLAPAEYYQILADSDIVLIPYSAQRYRYRSSGVLIEAMSAGRVVVTSAGSWMATQVTCDHAVSFDTPAGLGPAIAEAIDRFDELSAGADARREATLEHATGASLVRQLLAAVAPVASRQHTARPRVLFVMNGDAMAHSNGASRVALAQLQYLTAAKCEVVGLFLTYNAPSSAEAVAGWRAALSRSIAPFPLERVFIAGPGRWGSETEQSPSIRDQRVRSGAPLKAEFEFVASFEFGAPLMQFLRTHPLDAILLNYITNYPIVDALGLERVPVVCEMHDLQSFQRAIYGQRLVDDADLDEEFHWLARCTALVSLNPRETAIVRARLPDATIETTGVFLPTMPPLLPSLAGAKDLAEIVSGTGPMLRQYQFEAAWEIGKPEEVQRLIEVGSLDLVYVSSAHMANVSGLKWFLSEVYEPFLAQHRVSMIVAGSICRTEDWPQHPRLFFIDQVEDLTPLYAAARLVVLPITEGAGSPVKTFEALAYGRPIVGTSHAFRGIDGDPGEFIIRDDPHDFADAILDLVNSADARLAAAERSRQTAMRCNDIARYFRIMDGVFAPVLGTDGAAAEPSPRANDLWSGASYVEWSDRMQAVNRAVRSYLDGEPLEGWALDILAKDEEEGEILIDQVSRSLLEDRSAAVLRTERRLKRYFADPLGPRLRDHTTFAVRLALAERRGIPLVDHEPGSATRVVAYGGLPLTVAGAGAEAGPGNVALIIDGRAVGVRAIAGARPSGGQERLFQADIAALQGDNPGLRTIALDCAAPPKSDGALGHGFGTGIAVLRHSVPATAGLRLLGRDVFGGGFEVRKDGAGAELRLGTTGLLTLPRVADGRSVGYVDLCFARIDATQPIASAISLAIDSRPVELEQIGGSPTVLRAFIGAPGEVGDFGIMQLTIVNHGADATLRLLAAHSGLLVAPIEEATEIATVLALASQRSDRQGSLPLAAAARDAISMIIRGEPPAEPALAALRALVQRDAGHDAVRALSVQEISRASRRNGAARGTPAEADVVVADIIAIVGDAGDAATAILAPALPFDIVDELGQRLSEQTAAALRRRPGSWRVTMSPLTGECLRIALDAALDIPGHPGMIRHSGFHPPDNPEAQYRWTGLEPTATVTIPVALNRQAQLTIELGATGDNTDPGDFTVFCNGRAVPHRLAITGDETATLTAELPAAPLVGPSTTIALTVRECFQQPPDRRVLGVVFCSLSLLLRGSDVAQPQDQPRPSAAIEPSEPIAPSPSRPSSPAPARRRGARAASARPGRAVADIAAGDAE